MSLNAKDLEDQLNKEYKLLKKYEDRLRYDLNPRKELEYEEEVAKINKNIEQLQDQLAKEKELQREKSPAKKKIPFILPIEDRETFTGRETELNKLKDLLLSENKTRKVCSIAGLGGVGKSTLARYFAIKYQDKFPDGTIFIRVDGKDSKTIARKLAREVDVKIDSEDERDASTIMENIFASRRMLLIFDNAEDKNIKPLYSKGSSCSVIVTTRKKELPFLLGINRENRIDLPPLPEINCLELLNRLIGKDKVNGELNIAKEIIKLVGYLPLAIEIIGSQLQITETSLANYFQDLNDQEELISLKIEGDEYFNLEACFSLSLKSLEQDEIDFFACLSICAEESFSRRTAMIATGFDNERNTRRYLFKLLALSLLNNAQIGENRFVFHPLIRAYAIKKARERNLETEAKQRHSEYFLDLVKSANSKEESQTLANDLDDIILTAQWLKDQNQVDYDFADNLNEFFEEYGYSQKAIDLTHHFISSAEKNNDWKQVVIFNTRLAKYLTFQNQFLEAEKVLNKTRSLLNKIKILRDRQYAQIKLEVRCVRLKIKKNHYKEAEKIIKPIVTIVEELKDDKQLRNVLQSLAEIFQEQKKYDKALFTYHRLVDINEILEKKKILENVEDKGVIFGKIGNIYKIQKNFQNALSYFEKQIEFWEQLGKNEAKALTLIQIYSILQQQKNKEKSDIYLAKLVQLHKILNDQNIIHGNLFILANEHRKNRHYDFALETFEALFKFQKDLQDYYPLIYSLIDLRRIFEQGKKIYVDSNKAKRVINLLIRVCNVAGDKQILATAYNLKGRLLEKEKNFEEAFDNFKQELNISAQISDHQQRINSLVAIIKNCKKRQRLEQAFIYCEELADINYKQINQENQKIIALASVIDVLNYQGKSDKVLSICKKILQCSDIFDNNKILKRIIFQLFVSSNQEDNFEEINSWINNLIMSFEEAQKWKNACKLRIEIANCIRASNNNLTNNNLLLGEEILRPIPKLINKIESYQEQKAIELEYLITLQRIYKSQKRFQDTIITSKDSLYIAKLLQKEKELSNILLHLADTLALVGCLNEALMMLFQLVEINIKNDNQKDLLINISYICHILNKMIIIAFSRKRVNEALNHQKSIAIIHNYIGLIFEQQNLYDKALEAFLFSYAIEIQLSKNILINFENSDSIILILNKIAQIFEKKGYHKTATSFLRESQNICLDKHNYDKLANTMHFFGEILKKQQRWSEATSKFNQAYDAYRKLNNKKAQAIILNRLGQVLEKQKGEDNFKRALMNFKESVKLGQQLEDKPHLAKVYTAMGQSYLKHHQLEQSLDDLKKGFHIDEELRNAFGIEKVTPYLIYVLATLDRRKEALHYCQRAIQLSPHNQRLLDIEIKLQSGKKIDHPNRNIIGFVKYKKYDEKYKNHSGRIQPDDGSDDIYFREGFIDSQIIKKLKKGTRVEVEVKKNRHGLCARKIVIIES